jgi:hypothetical protein
MSEVISDVESRALVKIFGGGKLMFGGVSDVGTRWLRLVVPTGELRWILQKEKFALDDAQVKTPVLSGCSTVSLFYGRIAMDVYLRVLMSRDSVNLTSKVDWFR